MSTQMYLLYRINIPKKIKYQTETKFCGGTAIGKGPIRLLLNLFAKHLGIEGFVSNVKYNSNRRKSLFLISAIYSTTHEKVYSIEVQAIDRTSLFISCFVSFLYNQRFFYK